MKPTSKAPGIGSANQKGLSTGVYSTSAVQCSISTGSDYQLSRWMQLSGGLLKHSAGLIIGSTGSFIKLLVKQAYTGRQSSAIFGNGRQASAKTNTKTADKQNLLLIKQHNQDYCLVQATLR